MPSVRNENVGSRVPAASVSARDQWWPGRWLVAAEVRCSHVPFPQACDIDELLDHLRLMAVDPAGQGGEKELEWEGIRHDVGIVPVGRKVVTRAATARSSFRTGRVGPSRVKARDLRSMRGPATRSITTVSYFSWHVSEPRLGLIRRRRKTASLTDSPRILHVVPADRSRAKLDCDPDRSGGRAAVWDGFQRCPVCAHHAADVRCLPVRPRWASEVAVNRCPPIHWRDDWRPPRTRTHPAVSAPPAPDASPRPSPRSSI